MFIVAEIQKNESGVVSILNTTYEQRLEADAKYYQILSYAAVSSLPKHGAIMYTEDGVPIMYHCYRHGEDEETMRDRR